MYEHFYVGTIAWTDIVRYRKGAIPNTMSFAAEKNSTLGFRLSYGDIVSFAGDFFAIPDAPISWAADENGATRRLEVAFDQIFEDIPKLKALVGAMREEAGQSVQKYTEATGKLKTKYMDQNTREFYVAQHSAASHSYDDPQYKNEALLARIMNGDVKGTHYDTFEKPSMWQVIKSVFFKGGPYIEVRSIKLVVVWRGDNLLS